MRRSEVIDLLRSHRAQINAFGVRSIALFRSVARDEAGPGSDIDLLVEFDGPTRFRPRMLLLLFLEDLLGAPVDLATESMLPGEIVASVRKDLIPVA